MAAIPDVNGDGHAEVLVGAPFTVTTQKGGGAAFLYSGRDGKLLKQWTGKEAYGYVGWSVAALSDLDADGVRDFAIGAPYEDANGKNSGIVRIYSGKTRALIKEIKGAKDAFLGVAIEDCGDVDKDGTNDIVVGGHGTTSNGQNSGLANVYSGKTFALIWHAPGDSAFDFAGHAVHGAGDVDKDGHADFLVGHSRRRRHWQERRQRTALLGQDRQAHLPLERGCND